jgi:hypothetical protein
MRRSAVDDRNELLAGRSIPFAPAPEQQLRYRAGVGRHETPDSNVRVTPRYLEGRRKSSGWVPRDHSRAALPASRRSVRRT